MCGLTLDIFGNKKSLFDIPIYSVSLKSGQDLVKECFIRET